jgi:hypothetical protein
MELTNSPSPVSSDSLGGPDHDLDPLSPLEESLDDGQGGKRKSRRPPSTAERRATHNAVERARRESLNGRFMDLAGALPNMANVKRPSKSVIVAKSLEFVQGTQVREQYLLTQNDALRAEVNELRARLGMPAFSGPPASIPTPSNRNRKASSVSSGASLDSPLLSTPSSLSTSFDAVLPAVAPPASFAFNPAYAAAFPPAPTKDAGKGATPTPSQQQQQQAYNRAAPALDVNYLMALSMQQQQAQAHHNMLHMQGMGPPTGYQAVAPWMMPHSSAPVAAGGESPWLYH